MPAELLTTPTILVLGAAVLGMNASMTVLVMAMTGRSVLLRNFLIITAVPGVLAVILNQYQGGMCISGRLTMTERTPLLLISPSGPNWVGTDSAV